VLTRSVAHSSQIVSPPLTGAPHISHRIPKIPLWVFEQ
jgi:hypothetical protein